MAQRTMVQVTSDLSGDDNAESTSFAVDGTTYEIDLTEDERAAFLDAVSKYVDAGRKVGGGTRRRSSGGTSASKSSASGVDNSAVRAWARENGFADSVSDRGRISGKVIDAYKAANPS